MIQLRPYQIAAASKLSDILVKHRFAVDASDTGVGKTFTAIATALEFEPHPPVAVICKAKAVTKWMQALAQFPQLEVLFVTSWEKARSKKNPHFIASFTSKGKLRGFNLRLSRPTIVIFDEIHCAGGQSSQNGELVIACHRCPQAWTLGLSATLATDPLRMRALGYCLGLHQLHDYWNWCRSNGCGKAPFGGLYFRNKDRERVLGKLNRILFDSEDPRGIRLRKKELMDCGQFPKVETFVELWDVSLHAAKWLQEALTEVDKAEDADMEKHDWQPHGGILAMRDRQRSELLKLPALLDEIQDRLDEGESVIVFLQFTRSLRVVGEQLSKDGILYSLVAGNTPRSSSKRLTALPVEVFQRNQTRVCLCQIDAGSDSIDLHDVHGGHPRHMIVFPTYKAVTLIQALGRGDRFGAKTPLVRRIIYSAGGIEEKIARVVERRLENLSMLSDGELNAGGMI